jgi:hypothetical protein
MCSLSSPQQPLDGRIHPPSNCRGLYTRRAALATLDLGPAFDTSAGCMADCIRKHAVPNEELLEKYYTRIRRHLIRASVSRSRRKAPAQTFKPIAQSWMRSSPQGMNSIAVDRRPRIAITSFHFDPVRVGLVRPLQGRNHLLPFSGDTRSRLFNFTLSA